MIGEKTINIKRISLINKFTGMEDIGKIMIRREWRRAMMTRDDRWTKRIIECYQRKGKRASGRPEMVWNREM